MLLEYKPKKLDTKIVFVTGGVISGLGKGVTTASLAMLVKSSGFNVSALKADMYLNVDAGTMNPLEHGEVFVTEDGLETDQDLGNYERFLNRNLSKENYITMGQIYNNVITKERALGYNGKCVEGHIHVPEEISRLVLKAAKKDQTDILFVEVGGTVGEYQNLIFYEAIRRLKQEYPQDVFLVHLVYLVIPKSLGEMKSKPAQASIYELYKLGLQPDFVICRSEIPMDEKRRDTISFNTGIRVDHLISAPDVDKIYKIPLILQDQGMPQKLLETLGVTPKNPSNIEDWVKMVEKAEKASQKVKIAIVGKYFNSGDFSLEDSYVCVLEAIKHASWDLGVSPEIVWFNSEDLENPEIAQKVENELKQANGIIVPQGWGSRGVEGKVKTVQIARENKIPYLGLCFGMQMAVIEYARNVLGLSNANSEEVNPKTPFPVIHIMENQREYLAKQNYGGTIRLGAWPCVLKKGSMLEKIYSQSNFDQENSPLGITVWERHRHRYEVNNEFKSALEEKGLIISGISPDGNLVEAVELPSEIHPFFVGTQFHPEYKSRPLAPHPLFKAFIQKGKENLQNCR